MATLPLDLDGYTDLPHGKIVTAVTYLQMFARPEARKVIERPDLTLRKVEQPDLAMHRQLFRTVGEPWLWFGHLTLSDDELRAVLSEPTREVYYAEADGRPVGLLMLDFADPRNVELVYFGFVADYIGGGSGRWLMNHAIDLVFARPDVERFFVHTCTGDSPQALAFYQRSGFVPYKMAIEVADDPRLSGVLDPGCAPHIPCLKP